MDDNVLYPSPFTLFLICGEKDLSVCLSTEEISGCRVIQIETGEREHLSPPPYKRSWNFRVQFPNYTDTPPSLPPITSLQRDTLMKVYFSFVSCDIYLFASLKGDLLPATRHSHRFALEHTNVFPFS